MRKAAFVIGVIALLLSLCAEEATSQARVVDLLSGLQTGELWAQLRGAGDTQVTGVVGRTGTEPLIAQLDSGIQYQAQSRGRSGGGGRQSQVGVRTVSVDLTRVASASVNVPTVCINLGLRAPTGSDVMVPVACTDDRLWRLTSSLAVAGSSRPAVQLAVWAITDNPRVSGVRGYMRRMSGQVPGTDLLAQARALIVACGLNPGDFRLFR